MADDPQHKTTDFAARAGSDGEVMVTAPCGRVQFMSLWGFIRFAWAAAWAGRNIKVEDDAR